MKKILSFVLGIAVFSFSIYAQYSTDTSCMESISHVDWTTKQFVSQLKLDMQKADLELPSGRNSAERIISTKAPSLIKNPLLTLFVDSANYLGDMVAEEEISLEQVTEVIENSKQTCGVFSLDGKTLKATNTISLDNVSEILVKHKYPYTPEEPIETISSRAYTGIIIDARGSVPVHGEYISSEVYPCFFPTVWDENMNIVYEKNIVDRNIAAKNGIVHYDSSDNFAKYTPKVGNDPLYIKAIRVYGRNRTDPIIKKKDALKIFTVEKNRQLLKDGKVIILLDKKNLSYDVKTIQKDKEYYATYRTVKQYLRNKEYDVDLTESETGLTFRVDLKFYPDSPELLPEESLRIQKIADILETIVKDNEFTILVEGHCADLGKPVGEMNLSIDRTITVMNALINQGLNKDLFSYKGYGATRPIATNKTEEGRAQNRRVDITARPKATYIQKDW